jgi:hypothetical protein
MPSRNNRGFLPETDGAMLAWSAHFLREIESDPQGFGLSQQAVDRYRQLHEAFAALLQQCLPELRYKVVVIEKNAARAALKQEARWLVKQIDGTVRLSDAQRTELGLNVPRAAARCAVPADSPTVALEVPRGRLVGLHLRDAQAGRRGLPPGVKGALVFMWAGGMPDNDLAKWPLYTSTTKTNLQMDLTHCEPGETVWVAVRWVNSRLEAGPASTPVSVRLGYGFQQKLGSVKQAA